MGSARRWLTAVVALLLAGCSAVAVAQTPAATSSPDPRDGVQAFYDAVNRGDAAAAAALFTDSPAYAGWLTCILTCTSKDEIESALNSGLITFRPITVVYEQISPAVVITQIQGEFDRRADTYGVQRFEVSGDRIAAVQYEPPGQRYCSRLPQPTTVCPQYVQPAPPAPSSAALAPAEPLPVTSSPAEAARPVALGSRAIPLGVYLAGLGLVGLVMLGVLGTVGLWLIQRLARGRPRRSV